MWTSPRQRLDRKALILNEAIDFDIERRTKDRLLGAQAAPLLPMVASMFAIVYAPQEPDFLERNFLIAPKLHQNAAVPKLPVRNSFI